MIAAGKVIELVPKTRKKHAGGRPRACNSRVRATILDVARTGAHRNVIAASAGISLRTLTRFLQVCENALEKRDDGRRLTKEEEEFCQFCLDFHRSEIAVEIALLQVVRKAAESSPRAALAFLERRWPERWARRRVVQVVRADGIDCDDDDFDRPRRRRKSSAHATRVPLYTREELEAELKRRGL
jgi:hypothetical protein